MDVNWLRSAMEPVECFPLTQVCVWKDTQHGILWLNERKLWWWCPIIWTVAIVNFKHKWKPVVMAPIIATPLSHGWGICRWSLEYCHFGRLMHGYLLNSPRVKISTGSVEAILLDDVYMLKMPTRCLHFSIGKNSVGTWRCIERCAQKMSQCFLKSWLHRMKPWIIIMI